MSRKLRLLVQAMTAILTVLLVTGNCITEVDARVQTFVAMEKTPSINVTRSTTDESGAVVGISVAPTAEVPAPVKTEAPKVEAPKATPVAGIATDKLAMANVADAVNVRAEADEKSAMVGKLYSGCGGEIQDQKSGWTKIKSGKLTGWVRNDFLVFGSSAVTLAEKSLKKTATATTDTLRVRQEPNEYAEVVTLLAKGDTLAVVDTHGDWVQVKFADGSMGYVSGQYVTIANEIGKGETLEQINAREAQAKGADQKADDSAKVEAPVAPAQQVLPPVTNTGAVPAAADDVMLLAALIQCEAGNEIYEGQVAVGSVVVNRLKLGRYGNSLYNVIYAPSQFSPAGSGQVAAVLAAGPKASCIQAAQDALAGVNQVGAATKFRNVRSGYQGIVIGNHVFW